MVNIGIFPGKIFMYYDVGNIKIEGKKNSLNQLTLMVFLIDATSQLNSYFLD